MQRNLRWLLVLLLIGVFVLAACDSGGDDETEEPDDDTIAQVEETEAVEEVEETEEPQAEETEAVEEVEETEEAPVDAEETPEVTEEAPASILETAASDFTILVTAIEAAGLTETLSGEGPFTVFAPTDEALLAAVASFGMDPTEVLADTELLSSILLYHVIEGEVLSDAIMGMDGETVATAGGEEITISVTDDGIVLNDSVAVSELVDILASNGVIHVIDGVLLPESVVESLAAMAVDMTEEADMDMTEEAMMDDDDMGEMTSITSACLVTDQGGVNDGTFNELAANAVNQAAEEFGIEVSILESTTPTDFEPNIQTCLDSEAGAIVTVGFLLADATLAAAEANPDVFFIGVDQFFMGHPDNIVGLQFREDQAGFLAGVLAAQMSESGIIGGVYGIDIPPVVKFRNGFEQGARFVNADIELLGGYIASFVDPAAGQELAEALIGEGADVIFGAGGATGSGGITFAASEGAFVIGVDQDEYFTTFGGGESPGAEFIIGSAVKRVDVGVYNMLASLIDGSVDWQGGGLYILDAANDGIGLTEAHDADVPQEYIDAVDEAFAMLADGSLETGVDPVTGALMDDMMDMDEEADMDMTEEAPEAEATEEG